MKICVWNWLEIRPSECTHQKKRVNFVFFLWRNTMRVLTIHGERIIEKNLFCNCDSKFFRTSILQSKQQQFRTERKKSETQMHLIYTWLQNGSIVFFFFSSSLNQMRKESIMKQRKIKINQRIGHTHKWKSKEEREKPKKKKTVTIAQK